MKKIFDFNDYEGYKYEEIHAAHPVFHAVQVLMTNQPTKSYIPGCWTNAGLYDLAFITIEGKHYIALGDWGWLPSCPAWETKHIYEVEKLEGNQLYLEIKKSRFTSKKGKTFYKTTKI